MERFQRTSALWVAFLVTVLLAVHRSVQFVHKIKLSLYIGE